MGVSERERISRENPDSESESRRMAGQFHELLEADDLRARTDERPALAHRTDRIALRNETATPVVFVDDDPLTSVKEHRLIGYRGREETVEYVTCENPYYRAEHSARSEQFDRLDELGVPDDVIRRVINIDRIPLRPRGGSHGVGGGAEVFTWIAVGRI